MSTQIGAAPVRRTDSKDVRRIRTYYRQNQPIYDRYWTDNSALSMNYGLWTAGTSTRQQAFANQNRVIARSLAVRAGDRVLEAGCGTGGTSIWLAKTVGVNVTGITLVPEQARRARRYASERGVGFETSFIVGDYLCAPFPDGSFERIFASESVCYARDKADFLREAWRLLAPDGRLVVMDGFLRRTPRAGVESRLFDRWRDGWAVPGLTRRESFEKLLREVGFTSITYVDLTAAIGPSTLQLLWRGLSGIVVFKALEVVGVASQVQVNHAVSAACQYWLFRGGPGVYGVFTAVKGVTGGGHSLEDR
jgi:cyclopropane fatty-acyl-phospholipid synthase-like methyltransferase